MKLARIVQLAGRAFFTGVALLEACYCIVAYLPFTYHQIHQGGLLPLASLFVEYQPWLQLLAAAALAPALAGHFARGWLARTLAAGLLVFQVTSGVALLRWPVLSGLQNNLASFYWALAALLPLVWLAASDIVAFARTVEWPRNSPRQTGRIFRAAAGAGVFVPCVYAAVVWYRRETAIQVPEDLPLLGLSFAAQLVLGLGLFLLLEWLTALAGLFRCPAKAEFWLSHVLLASGVAAFLEWIVGPNLGQPGWSLAVLSAALGIVLAALNAGVSLWLETGRAADSGIGAATASLRLGYGLTLRTGIAVLLVLGIAGGWLTVRAAAMDWNGLMQIVITTILWMAAFGCLYAIAARPGRASYWLPLCTGLAVLGLYKLMEPAAAAASARTDAWAGYDVSLQLARRLLSPVPRDDGSFYRFVARNTNIPASVPVAPVDLNLVPALGASGQKRPNIFIVVVDSLRRDYLSPYNGAVSFTPSIGRFARESVVFRNAFTRYGGTGLSEPSIWTGAMLLHKQYTTPFAPMNTLQKLLRAEGYQTYVSRDSVLRVILDPDPGIVDLDPPDSTMTYQLDRSLGKLEEQIGRRPAGSPPVFAYTQPQSIHISVIRREGSSVPPGESYPGFSAPYASRVKRVDAAFGQFVDFLKDRGLYQDSILVLTADHGDSLGEEGRWGHAYTIFPEVVHIPLIVHLPPWLSETVTAGPESLAFSTDITPSLYYLLGHPPVLRNDLTGTPLFTKTPDERTRGAGGSFLIASSYAPVYGMLSHEGKQLFIADAVNFKNYLFAMRGEAAEARTVSESFKHEQETLIKQALSSIGRFYGYASPGGERP